jgi:phosphinothricin acetyltransferase
MYNIRLSKDEDKEQVIAIFNYYIQNTMAAYPLSPLPVQAWGFIKSKCINGTILVAEDESGKVVGFALLKSFMDMDTFSHTADIGYFIDPNHVGKGLGKRFITELEATAKSFGIKILTANVSSANPESIAFHEHCGFVKCGELPNVGKKKDEYFNMIWYYKDIT